MILKVFSNLNDSMMPCNGIQILKYYSGTIKNTEKTFFAQNPNFAQLQCCMRFTSKNFYKAV